MSIRDYEEATEAEWMLNGLMGNVVQTTGSGSVPKKSLRGFGMSQSKRTASGDGSAFNSSSGSGVNASSIPSIQLSKSTSKNTDQFKVPHLKSKGFGLSQARFNRQKPSDEAMEVDACSFNSSAGANEHNKLPQTFDFVRPPRFSSSLSKQNFNNSFGNSPIASANKFSSSFGKGSFSSSFSKGRFGNSADVSRFDQFYTPQNFPTATSLNASFGSVGSRGTAEGYGNKFASNLNSSRGSLNNSFQGLPDRGLLNKSFGSVSKASLSSFGRMKTDFLSYEAAQKKLHNSRNR